MSRFQLAVNRLISGTSRFELVYCTHSSWPLPPSNQDKTIVNEPLSVSVLDSSFNPPTIAHAALASAPYAEPTLSCPTVIPRLLLLSISNADKTPKAGDATLAQRLEMMVALADELAVGSGSVGVGALNEPTFVGKSTLLCEQLESGLVSEQKVQLTFLMGWDTIIRVFAPRYYPSPETMLERLGKFFEAEGSSILCARRGEWEDPLEEAEFLASPYVAPFFKQGKIALVDLPRAVRNISSSGVRAGTIEGAEKACSGQVVKYIREHELYFWKKEI